MSSSWTSRWSCASLFIMARSSRLIAARARVVLDRAANVTLYQQGVYDPSTGPSVGECFTGRVETLMLARR
jgi:hypothetical protein